MVFQTKLTFAVLVLVVCCSLYSSIAGSPNTDSVQDVELVNAVRKNPDSVTSDAARYKRHLMGKGGCYKNYCWAGCYVLGGREWCYTTKTYSQSFQYVKCTRNEECDRNWKCAGSCTL